MTGSQTESITAPRRRWNRLALASVALVVLGTALPNLLLAVSNAGGGWLLGRGPGRPGVLDVPFFVIFLLPTLIGLVCSGSALATAVVARRQIIRSGEGGMAAALIGLILGGLGTLLAIVGVLVGIPGCLEYPATC